MNTNRSSRRSWLARSVTLMGTAMLSRFSHAELNKTPTSTEGPYYPKPSIRVADTDNDLVKVAGVVTEAGGEIITLKGVVSDKSGQSLSGVRVEIWQCDVNGKYLHPGDSRNIKHDNAFQGFGHDITNEKGEYSFRTIKPTKYPGRTPHIHVKVCIGEKELLTTQFYIDGEPDNVKDSIFRRLSPLEAASVSMQLVQEGGHSAAVVNIVV